jgi:hypothetical protein
MNEIDVRKKIMSLDSLNELASWIKSQPENNLRRSLLAQFDAFIEYEDANQWATAVRLCESLAIIGWGSREAVDAISRHNGDCWETRFITDKNESRFRYAGWLKRKAGWILGNPQYYFSPDFPDKPAVDWRSLADKDFALIDCERLTSQRNYSKQLPIIMGLIGGSQVSNAVGQLKQELTIQLQETMTPSLYGEAIEKFFFTLHCTMSTKTNESSLKVGTFNTKQRAFYADLFFDGSFADLSPHSQREYFAENLLVAIDALGIKLKKRKIQFNIQVFRSDVVTAIDKWRTSS